MEKNDRKGPVWKAPETLVPRVMRAVAAGTRGRAPQGFHTWSTSGRVLFSCGVAAAAAAGTAMSLAIQPPWDPSSILTSWFGLFGTLLNALGAAQTVAVAVASSSATPMLCIIIGCCLLTMVTWAAGVSGLYFVLTAQQRRIPL